MSTYTKICNGVESYNTARVVVLMPMLLLEQSRHEMMGVGPNEAMERRSRCTVVDWDRLAMSSLQRSVEHSLVLFFPDWGGGTGRSIWSRIRFRWSARTSRLATTSRPSFCTLIFVSRQPSMRWSGPSEKIKGQLGCLKWKSCRKGSFSRAFAVRELYFFPHRRGVTQSSSSFQHFNTVGKVH